MKGNECVMKFGKRISSLRMEKGITQEELSFRSGLNRTYVGEIERGEKNASVVTIDKLAKGLNVRLKELFDYE